MASSDKRALLVDRRQHRELEQVMRAARVFNRGTVQQASGSGHAVKRVIAPTEPAYDGQEMTCPVFEFRDEDSNCWTVYQFGNDLQGKITISVDGSDVATLACDADQSEVFNALSGSLKDWRITVWPGTWEFDGAVGDAHTITARAEDVPDPEPDDFVTFDGELLVVKEQWVSSKRILADDSIEFDTVQVVPSFPFVAGEYPAGSIGHAHHLPGIGWLCDWKCRELTYR